MAPVALPSPFRKVNLDGLSVSARPVLLSNVTPDERIETRSSFAGSSDGTSRVISTSPSEYSRCSLEKKDADALFTKLKVSPQRLYSFNETSLRSTRELSLTSLV